MTRVERHCSGFTLIEVMVALSVLALGIAGATRLTQAGYQQLAAADEYRRAAYLAHSHLSSLQGNQQRDFAPQRGAYNEFFRWELTFRSLEPAVLQGPTARLSERVSVHRAELSVWFDDDQRSLSFHSLVFSPPPVPGTEL